MKTATTTRRKISKIAPLPTIEVPQERGQRYSRLRVSGLNYDQATRVMFEQDVRTMKTARPEWDAERVAQEIRDLGLYCREGYRWTVKVATETLGAY